MAFQDIEVSRTQAVHSEAVQASSSTEFGRVYAVFGKRILDIILALLLMPVLLPVLAVIWVVIQRDGGSAG
jgi:lipopolysaccharide/colanic/teichoic acid biosynthesis glycosyltransferase